MVFGVLEDLAPSSLRFSVTKFLQVGYALSQGDCPMETSLRLFFQMVNSQGHCLVCFSVLSPLQRWQATGPQELFAESF